MEQWSFPVGRLFGVEVRLHLLFAILLAGCSLWASALGHPPLRGVLLWGVLLLAVVLREVARGLAAAWCGLPVRALVLLPTGGFLDVYAQSEPLSAGERRVMALVGPLSSLLAGLVLAGACLAVAPQLDLVAQPWVTPLHLLRSAVWIQLILGAINLLPAWPFDGGRLLERGVEGKAQARTVAGKGAGLLGGRRPNAGRQLGLLWGAVALVTAGLIQANGWLLAAGLAGMFLAQAARQGLAGSGAADGVAVADVMLTEFSVLPASATLEDALGQARHSLQEWFPVVRGGAVVGAISRKQALDAMARDGNGYLQGAMRRRFATAAATEPLDEMLARVSSLTGEQLAQLVPVLDGEQVVGVLTPEHLSRSLSLLQRDRALAAARRLLEGERP